MELRPDSVALVTGANGGIGQAIARALRTAGAQVVVSGRRSDALAGIARDASARVALADLTRRDEVARLAEDVGPVDVLVLNAALPATGHLLDFTSEEIDRALDVNLRAPIVLAHAFAKKMAERGRGQIVFISSLAGKVATPGASMYSATKFGMRGFALALREDLRPRGVGVTTIFPGFIRDAGMFADTGVKLPRGTGTRSPEDVARAVLTAVRANPAEIDVAAIEQTVGAYVAGLSPAFAGIVQRWLGADGLSKQIIDAQRNKR